MYFLYKRREFITLLGGAAAAWPLAARAQTNRVRKIGVLLGGSENDAEMRAEVFALQKGLQELGWTEGRNVHFEFRWPNGDLGRTRDYAMEFVGLAPDVIVTGTTPAAIVLQRETRSIPVVFVNLADPVGTGLVRSLANPGGNMTGFTAFEFSITGKWLELLKEIAPRVTRVALIFGALEVATVGELFYRTFEAAARAASLEPIAIRIRTAADIDPAIDAFAAQPNVGLVAAAEVAAVTHRVPIINAVARHRLPAVYPFRYFATDGGLAAYGVSLVDQYRRAASYVDRILRGVSPSDLPVQAPDKFELVFNLKTARAQGIDISPVLLARADEVIE
jgi:putative tryptophan/tyrosine transport system substrate-binding protein